MCVFLLIPLLTHCPTPLVDEEHVRALEEQWIDALGSGGGVGSGSAESDSRARAVLNGIIIGFFFPLLPLFSYARQSPPLSGRVGMLSTRRTAPCFRTFPLECSVLGKQHLRLSICYW
jgi:hypothetical protein